MGVTVSSDNLVSIVVTEGDSVSVNVAQSQQGGVNAYGGIGPTILVNGTVTSIVGTIGINPFVAGPNITITTAGGSITVSGRTPPVLSVQGKTGAVTLSASDFGIGLSDHTHATSQIAGLASFVQQYANVLSVQGRTGSVVIAAADVGAASATHSHVSADITDLTSVIDSSRRVHSVQGYTGTVTLTVADLSAAAASHTHSTTDISGLTATIRSVSPVFSVQGFTGAVTLLASDFTAAPASHTHSTTDISGLTATIRSVSPVFSVQGYTGTVTLTVADVSAAAASHTHSTTDISGLTATIRSFANVSSVQGKTGTVTLSYSDITTGRVISNLVRYGLPGSAENPLSLSVAGQTNVPLVLSLPPDGSSGTAGLCFAPTFSLDQQYVASSRGTDSLIGDLEELSNELGSLQSRWPSVGWPSGRGIVSSTPLGLRTSSGFVHTLNGCTGTVSIQAGANISVAASGTAITISAASNTNAVQAAIWPALILGG